MSGFTFDPRDWYWIIGPPGPHLPDESTEFPPTTQVYSSARDAYVPVNDTAYQDWVAAALQRLGYDPTTRIDTEANLVAALDPYGFVPTFP